MYFGLAQQTQTDRDGFKVLRESLGKQWVAGPLFSYAIAVVSIALHVAIYPLREFVEAIVGQSISQLAIYTIFVNAFTLILGHYFAYKHLVTSTKSLCITASANYDAWKTSSKKNTERYFRKLLEVEKENRDLRKDVAKSLKDINSGTKILQCPRPYRQYVATMYDELTRDEGCKLPVAQVVRMANDFLQDDNDRAWVTWKLSLDLGNMPPAYRKRLASKKENIRSRIVILTKEEMCKQRKSAPLKVAAFVDWHREKKIKLYWLDYKELHKLTCRIRKMDLSDVEIALRKYADVICLEREKLYLFFDADAKSEFGKPLNLSRKKEFRCVLYHRENRTGSNGATDLITVVEAIEELRNPLAGFLVEIFNMQAVNDL